MPPYSSGMVRPKTPMLGEAVDDFERDIGVGAVPVLRVRDDFGVGEAAHLGADRLEGLVEAGIADRALVRLGDQRRQARARFGACCPRRSGFRPRSVRSRGDLRARRGRNRRGGRSRPGSSAMPPKIWARYSPRPIRVSSSSVSPKRPSALHAARVAGHLAGSPRHRSRARRARARRAARARFWPRSELPSSLTRAAQALSGAREQVLDGALGFSGEIVERHGLLPEADVALHNASAHDPRQCPFRRRGRAPYVDAAASCDHAAAAGRLTRPNGAGRQRMRWCAGFGRSHSTPSVIFSPRTAGRSPATSRLSTLMSLFPFLIFVTALAGFFGSQDLADEVARLIFSAWPAAVAGPIADEVRDVLTRRAAACSPSARCWRSISPPTPSRRCASGSTAPTPAARPGRGGCCGCSRSPS